VDLQQEDIVVAQKISFLALQYGFTITGSGTRQNEEIGQLQYTGPDENKTAFAGAVNQMLVEMGKAV